MATLSGKGSTFLAANPFADTLRVECLFKGLTFQPNAKLTVEPLYILIIQDLRDTATKQLTAPLLETARGKLHHDNCAGFSWYGPVNSMVHIASTESPGNEENDSFDFLES